MPYNSAFGTLMVKGESSLIVNLSAKLLDWALTDDNFQSYIIYLGSSHKIEQIKIDKVIL